MPADGDQAVIRTGAATPRLLAAAVSQVNARRCQVRLDSVLTGLSVHTARLPIQDLTRYARYPDARISVSSLRMLAEAGFRLVRTPLVSSGRFGADPLHATVALSLTPPVEMLARLAAAFSMEIDNAFPRACWAGGDRDLRDLSVLDGHDEEAYPR